jgi:surface antigen
MWLPGACISTIPSTSITERLVVPATSRSTRFYRRLQLKLRRKTIHRRAVRIGLVLSNVVILGVILAFVLQNPRTNGLATPALLNDTPPPAAANPLDQVSSADIAQTVAQLNGLPETTAITNQAQSQAADIAIASSDNNVVSKPQVVATALKSRADIQAYTTQAGDTISSLAAKFGVTSDSIRWSNNLSGDNVAAGTKLVIPPVNGIVYTVKAGDTADILAARFNANKDQIIAYNDGEISGLKAGEQIIIPGATQLLTASAISSSSSSSSSFPWGSGPMYGFNGYDYGYCTWYVASQISVPGNWGNASSWAYYARLSGWNVSTAPTVGAIAQKGGGEGHVAIVTAVNPDGSVQVRDMNGFAGWGRVGTGTVSPSTFQNYITH